MKRRWVSVILLLAVVASVTVSCVQQDSEQQEKLNAISERVDDLEKRVAKLEGSKDEVKYVASKLREPFHNLSCIWAKRISESNKVSYITREEVIANGKRPCKVCRP